MMPSDQAIRPWQDRFAFLYEHNLWTVGLAALMTMGGAIYMPDRWWRESYPVIWWWFPAALGWAQIWIVAPLVLVLAAEWGGRTLLLLTNGRGQAYRSSLDRSSSWFLFAEALVAACLGTVACLLWFEPILDLRKFAFLMPMVLAPTLVVVARRTVWRRWPGLESGWRARSEGIVGANRWVWWSLWGLLPASAGIFVFVLFAPVWPFRPICQDFSGAGWAIPRSFAPRDGRLEGDLSPEFRLHLAKTALDLSSGRGGIRILDWWTDGTYLVAPNGMLYMPLLMSTFDNEEWWMYSDHVVREIMQKQSGRSESIIREYEPPNECLWMRTYAIR